MTPRAILLYRQSCPTCRFLSALAVAVSLGTLLRAGIGSPEADGLARMFPKTRGKLALVDGERVDTGLGVLWGGVRVLILAPLRWMRPQG